MTTTDQHPFEPHHLRPEFCGYAVGGGLICGRAESHHFHAPPEPGQPDPLVLRLPEVPEGTQALVVDQGDDQGKRYIPVQGTHYWNAPETGGDARFNVLELLVAYRRLRVELAPPREPRTWTKLDGPPSDLRKVEVNGRIWTRDNYATGRWTDDRGDRATFSQLRASGEVKEVIEP